MTQKEFTERTGLTPTAEEFATIHRIYMACPHSIRMSSVEITRSTEIAAS